MACLNTVVGDWKLASHFLPRSLLELGGEIAANATHEIKIVLKDGVSMYTSSDMFFNACEGLSNEQVAGIWVKEY